ncbi:hypothetical protein B188_25870 [Candidatus Brocadiaceae bacterium B188]|nr:hypothetical protein B188_25870 [Candidatus Brocadiaceae bacterium B188]
MTHHFQSSELQNMGYSHCYYVNYNHWDNDDGAIMMKRTEKMNMSGKMLRKDIGISQFSDVTTEFIFSASHVILQV